MKYSIKTLIFSLFAITTYAQQATEIDSKSVKLPRYANQAAIELAIPITQRQQGMMVFNTETASNWLYNGVSWVNTLGSVAAPLNLLSTNGSVLSSINSGIGSAATFQTTNENNGEATLSVLSNVRNVGGFAGRFEVNNLLGYGIPLFATSNGYGVSIVGTMDGFGNAAAFNTTKATNSLPTFRAWHEGNGRAGEFIITKSSNNKDALFVHTDGSGVAISALNNSSTNATLKIKNETLRGNALEIDGGIKVSGVKSAFKVVAYSTYIAGNKLGIQNSTMANASSDILIVTYEHTGGSYLNKQFATFWNGGNWEIHLTDGSAMPVGITFNVLVIKQ